MKKKIAMLIAALLFVGGIPVYSGRTSLAKESKTKDSFTIGICTDENNYYYKQVASGFKAVMAKGYGDDSVRYIEQKTMDSKSASTAVEALVQSKCDLLFVYGSDSLAAAADLTESIPILFAGVLDPAGELHFLPNEDNTTGRNISGITSMPSIDDQVSLLIEASGMHPKKVAIPYDPQDINAIMQNEIFEGYLDTAGIAWKEYEYSLEDSGDTSASQNTNTDIPFPSISHAPSAKEGSNIHPDPIGDSGDLTGLNEPLSARSARTSERWSGSKKMKSADAIYICSRSAIASDTAVMARIKKTSLQNHIVSVGGDEVVGENTTVCLYEDPYNIGMRLANEACDVLEGEIEISGLPIAFPDPSKSAKLYNSALSDALGRSWPKSFKERGKYLKEYDPDVLNQGD